MLQDFEAGRMLELEAVIGSIAEIGRLTETRCPAIDAVYACAKFVDTIARKPGQQLADIPMMDNQKSAQTRR